MTPSSLARKLSWRRPQPIGAAVLGGPAGHDAGERGEPREPRAPAPARPQGLSETLRGTIGLVLVLSLFMNLLALALPLYTMQIFERVLPSGNRATLVVLTLLVGGLLVALTALDALRARVMIRIANRLDLSWQERLLGHAFEGRPATAGGPHGRAVRDLDLVRGFLAGPSATALVDAPWAVIFIGVIFLLHPLLGMISLIGAVMLLVLAVIGDLASRRRLALAQRFGGETHEMLEAQRHGLEALSAIGATEGLLRRCVGSRTRELAQHSVGMDRLAVVGAMARGVRLALQVVLLATAALLALEGALVAGAIIAASMLMARALSPLERVAGGWRQALQARDAFHRLRAAAATAPETKRTSLPRPQGRIEAQRLHVWAEDRSRPALRDLNLVLEPGELLTVVGPSGAGKSTLARALVGLVAPRAGVLRIDGASLVDWNRRELAGHLGYLPQEVELQAGTVAENIARFGVVDDRRLVDAAQAVGAHQHILRLPEAYETRIGRNCRLSPGERQRIGLARALYGDPAIVVLDEPTTHLDHEGDRSVLRLVQALKDKGVTTIVVSRLPGLMHITDHLLMLSDGRVQFLRPRAEIEPFLALRVAPDRPRAAEGGAS